MHKSKAYKQTNKNHVFADPMYIFSENGTETPKVLLSRSLQVNNTKTEGYVINRENSNWKNCKLLGSLLDTVEDMKRRKTLVITAANNIEHIFKNKRITQTSNVQAYKTYSVYSFVQL